MHGYGHILALLLDYWSAGTYWNTIEILESLIDVDSFQWTTQATDLWMYMCMRLQWGNNLCALRFRESIKETEIKQSQGFSNCRQMVNAFKYRLLYVSIRYLIRSYILLYEWPFNYYSKPLKSLAFTLTHPVVTWIWALRIRTQS